MNRNRKPNADDGAVTSSNGNDNRSIGQVVQDVTHEFRDLFREEIALAKAEINQAMRKVIAGGVLLAIGAVLANAGLNALLAAAVLGLALTWEAWAAALVVGIGVIVVGGILAWSGIRSVKDAELKPDRTLETLKEDTQAVKEGLR